MSGREVLYCNDLSKTKRFQIGPSPNNHLCPECYVVANMGLRLQPGLCNCFGDDVGKRPLK